MAKKFGNVPDYGMPLFQQGFAAQQQQIEQILQSIILEAKLNQSERESQRAAETARMRIVGNVAGGYDPQGTIETFDPLLNADVSGLAQSVGTEQRRRATEKTRKQEASSVSVKLPSFKFDIIKGGNIMPRAVDYISRVNAQHGTTIIPEKEIPDPDALRAAYENAEGDLKIKIGDFLKKPDTRQWLGLRAGEVREEKLMDAQAKLRKDLADARAKAWGYQFDARKTWKALELKMKENLHAGQSEELSRRFRALEKAQKAHDDALRKMGIAEKVITGADLPKGDPKRAQFDAENERFDNFVKTQKEAIVKEMERIDNKLERDIETIRRKNTPVTNNIKDAIESGLYDVLGKYGIKQ